MATPDTLRTFEEYDPSTGHHIRVSWTKDAIFNPSVPLRIITILLQSLERSFMVIGLLHIMVGFQYCIYDPRINWYILIPLILFGYHFSRVQMMEYEVALICNSNATVRNFRWENKMHI